MKLCLTKLFFQYKAFHWRFSALLLCGLLSGFQHSIGAENNLILSSSHLKLATGNHYSPFVDDKLPNGGWSVSIVKRVLDKMSLTFEMAFLPWERALMWTREDKIFGTFPFVYSEQRAETLLYSKPINFVPVHMYVADHSGFESPQALMSKRLCFPYDYTLSPLEQGIVDEYSMSVNRVKDGLGCIKHVQKGWSDAGLINGYVDRDKLLSGQYAIRVFEQQLALVPLSFVVNKKRENAQLWIDKFNHVLSIITHNGERAAIDQQYLHLLKQH